jgi:hypothetical protein
MHPNNSKSNFRFADVFRAGFGLAMADGGFVIGVQIVTFLLGYFVTKAYSGHEIASLGLSKANFIVSIISILNLSVIIYRVTGLSRGIKYAPFTCYQHAIRRWPVLLLLYMLGSVLLIVLAIPMLTMLQKLLGISLHDHQNLLIFLMLSFIPVGVLACIFVVDQAKNPWQAIIATFNMIRYKISFNMLLNLSMLYTLPFSFSSLFTTTTSAHYLALFNAIWFLFCHVLTIVIYAATIMTQSNEETEQKPTKVVVI